MHFDNEGHLVVSPREVQALAFSDKNKLINTVLLPGTPRAISTYSQYCRLLYHIADKIGIHPNNLLLKGSTKIGFSIAPRPEKVWMEYGPASDLDLAIVDAGFFQVVDYEVGRWEWNPDNRGRMFLNRRLLNEYRKRTDHKGRFDCFRFFDLPTIPSMERLRECLESAPVEDCCGFPRLLRAFVFRDWWGVWKRYDFDLYCLCRGLQQVKDPLPPGGEAPRVYQETEEPESEELD